MTRGLCAGFGEPIGRSNLDALRERHVDAVRQDLALAVDHGRSPLPVIEELEAFQEMGAIYIVNALDQIGLLRAGSRAEWMNEPDLAGWTPEDYGVTCRAAQHMADLCGVEMLFGSVSNLSRDRQAWLAGVLPYLSATASISVHRYPAKDMTAESPQKGYTSRVHETADLFDLVQGRPVYVTEFGYHMARFQPGLWPCVSRRLSETDVAARVAFEWKWWEASGAKAAYLYQFQDGPTDTKLDRYGIRSYTYHWKAAATTFARAGDPA
jgi:hypothetical protein